jgi:hypothetical protein
MNISQSEPVEVHKQPTLRFTYMILIPITFVSSLIFGIFMVWVPSLSPWLSYLSPVSEAILQLSSVRQRYEISTEFCGECGDRYLLTLELFLLMASAYTALFCFIFLRRVMQNSAVFLDQESIEKPLKAQLAKALGTSLLFCLALGAVLWSLLFSPDFSRPKGSASDYSMFNFGLLFIVNIAFHIILVFIVPAVEIVGAVARLAMPSSKPKGA